MKVTFFTSHILWSTHYETELELIQSALDTGHQVEIISCTGFWKVCDTNFEAKSSICLRCNLKRRFGRSFLKGNYKEIQIEKLLERNNNTYPEVILDLGGIQTVRKLKEIEVDTFKIGMTVASSLISYFRDPNFSIQQNLSLVSTLLKSTWDTYTAVFNYLVTHKPNQMYLFNGRFSHSGAAFAACKINNVNVMVHERGSTIYKYEVFKNSLPHDIRQRQEQIEKYWQDDQLEKENIAAKFYEERRNGVIQFWKSFVKDQEKQLLPANFNADKKNFVIFSSSEDEFEAIGPEWRNPFFENQLEGISFIKNHFKGDENVHLYLRIHPNLAKVKNEYNEKILNLSGKNFTTISPTDPVSSYALLDKSDVIITFGSSMGMEAVYSGKPVITLGKCFYWGLGGQYIPRNKQQISELLSKDLTPLDRNDAIKFGYYLRMFGNSYKYYVPESTHSGKYRGYNLNPLRNNDSLIHRIKTLYKFIRSQLI